jgi:hypothetical protein
MSARLSQVREQLRNADAKHLNWYRELVEAQRAHRQAADELTVLRNKVFPLIEAARVQTRHWEEMGFVCHDHLEAVASAIDTYLETL